MSYIEVKLLEPNAKLPTVAHPGEDLAYDVYALEDTELPTAQPRMVRTGIAAQAYATLGAPLGFLIRDRSSMAAKGIVVSGGVIDPGYTGEIKVILTYTIPALHATGFWPDSYKIKAGDKIAQMIPIPILTGEVIQVDLLEDSQRGNNGFGSSGN